MVYNKVNKNQILKGITTMTKINQSTISEEELLNTGYRKYTGEDIDIFYNKDLCQHVGNCTKGSPEIFEVKRRPWILADNDSVEKAADVINTCPSGALKYIQKNADELHFIQQEKKIVVIDNSETVLGEITWSQAGDSMIIIDHTFVDEAARGRGIAEKLVKEAVDYARKNNQKVIPLCPFAKREFDRKKEYQDLLN